MSNVQLIMQENKQTNLFYQAKIDCGVQQKQKMEEDFAIDIALMTGKDMVDNNEHN